MDSTPTAVRPGRRRLSSRFGVIAAAVALSLGAAATAAPAVSAEETTAPTPAQQRVMRMADKVVDPAGAQDITWNIPEVSCSALPDVQWITIVLFNHVIYAGYKYTVVSAPAVFNVSDGRVVDNTTADPISATFTSSTSRTWSVTTTHTVSNAQPLVDKFNATISTAIMESRTTMIGVSATATVPPHSRLVGDYGVEAFDVTYDAQLVFRDAQTGRCYDAGVTRAFTNAPTFVEGWRFRLL